jgi:mannosyltransferase OCH1-like enzyme
MSTHINPIFFQISREYQPPELVNKIKKFLPLSWRYVSYKDVDAEAFFLRNPSEEFPNILERWRSFSGAHRTDVFRYYHLYLYGGFYMDSDAMIYDNIETIIGDCNFVTAHASSMARTFFQGVIGCSAGHPIIKEALRDACNTDPEFLKHNYHHWCRRLFMIYTCQDKTKTRLLPEIHVPSGEGDMVLNHNGDVVFKHYWKYKVIP